MWKKSFRKLPTSIADEIVAISSNDISVIAPKVISLSDIESGIYEHVNLTPDRLFVGSVWAVLPDVKVGTTSKRNVEGWSIPRPDLPKIRKYYVREIENFGNGSRNGWSTVSIPRDVSQKDELPPKFLEIVIRVEEELPDGTFGVAFSIDTIFSKIQPDFNDAILFALNLLQENSGVTGVSGSEDTTFSYTNDLDWEVFPPGDLDAVIQRLNLGAGASQADGEEVLRERLELFNEFEPLEYLRGLGGTDAYIGARYSDDLVVFENVRKGNALYFLYGNWQNLSQRPRSELLKLRNGEFDRIIHSQGWEQRFRVLLHKQLMDRGIRIRINRRRRR